MLSQELIAEAKQHLGLRHANVQTLRRIETYEGRIDAASGMGGHRDPKRARRVMNNVGLNLAFNAAALPLAAKALEVSNTPDNTVGLWGFEIIKLLPDYRFTNIANLFAYADQNTLRIVGYSLLAALAVTALVSSVHMTIEGWISHHEKTLNLRGAARGIKSIFENSPQTTDALKRVGGAVSRPIRTAKGVWNTSPTTRGAINRTSQKLRFAFNTVASLLV